MNLREPYAGTAFAGLGWSEVRERPIDRVAAAGFCDELGMFLWKAKYQHSASATVKALRTLEMRFKVRYQGESWDLIRRVVAQCLLEYLKPNCDTCLGRGEMKLEDRIIVCTECRGSSAKHYTDYERARSMQISLAKAGAIGHKLKWLSAEIGKLDAGVNVVMSEQLGRAVA